MNRRMEAFLAERQSQLHTQKERAKVTCSMLNETEKQLLRVRNRAHWMQSAGLMSPPQDPQSGPTSQQRGPAARPTSAAPYTHVGARVAVKPNSGVRTAAWASTGMQPAIGVPAPSGQLGEKADRPQHAPHNPRTAGGARPFTAGGLRTGSSRPADDSPYWLQPLARGLPAAAQRGGRGAYAGGGDYVTVSHSPARPSSAMPVERMRAKPMERTSSAQSLEKASAALEKSTSITPLERASSAMAHSNMLARPRAAYTSSAGVGVCEQSTWKTTPSEEASEVSVAAPSVPVPTGAGSYSSTNSEDVAQQKKAQALVKLALRASVQGGTGVGCTMGHAVGISELYKLGKAIGEGSFGFVRVAQERISEEYVAVKTFEKSRIRDSAARRRLENEIRVLQRVRHPYVVRLFEVFESPQRVHLCMEHVGGGTLYKHLHQHKRLPEAEVRRLLRQLVGALYYLHHRFVAHRDIKLENVLLDQKHNVKLIDFGFAVLTRNRLKVACGSPAYTAPEILKAQEYDGRQADMWSLGVLMYVMLAGRFPFNGASRKELSHAILRGIFPSPQGVSREPDSLIRRMLVLDPAQRYSVDNVRKHMWMSNAIGESELVTEHSEAVKIESRVIGEMTGVGFNCEDVEQESSFLGHSVCSDRHDHINTTYLLLAEKRRKQEASSKGGKGSALHQSQRCASVSVGSAAAQHVCAYGMLRPRPNTEGNLDQALLKRTG